MPNYDFLKHKTANHLTSLPYGAADIEQTDFKELRKSLLEQIQAAGLPKPKHLELIPHNSTNEGSATQQRINGGFPVGDFFGPDADVNTLFPNQPCNPSFNIAAYHTFAGLHETAHYVTYNIFKNEAARKNFINLNVEVFDKINRLDPITYQQYISSIATAGNVIADLSKRATTPEVKILYEQIGSDLANQKTVAYYTGSDSIGQIPERIADAGAALYMLSNYGNTEKTRSFIQEFQTLRDANTVGTASHNTSSSLAAAQEAFDKNPRKGMSIIDTTKWAAEIVGNQPEFNRDADFHKDMAAIARDMDNQASAENVFLMNKHPEVYGEAAGKKFINQLPADDKKAVTEKVDKITAARAAVCKTGPTSP